MNYKVLLSFLVVYIVWGSTFAGIKLGLEDFPPLILSGLRFYIAGAVFFILAKDKLYKDMSKRDLTREMMTGILLTSANASVCWAQEYVSSSVAALIAGSIPIVFVIFNWLAFERKTPHITAILGLLTGFVGIAIISLDGSSISSGVIVLALIFSNCLWVFGSLSIKTTKTNLSYFSRSSVQFITGGSFLLILSSLIGERQVIWSEVSMTGISSLFFLAFFGTIIAYTCYTYLLKNVDSELVSTYALVNPVVAIFLGSLWLSEPLTPKIVAATPLIILSIGLVIYGKKFYEYTSLRLKKQKV